MFAVVKIAGFQFKVEKGDKLFVHRLPHDKGAEVTFDEVLLLDQDGQVTIGQPTVIGAGVRATVLDHVKDKKVIVFKKKRRKGYRVKNGHRQALTQIQIDGIVV